MKKKHILSALFAILLFIAGGVLLHSTKSGYFLKVWWFAIHGDPMNQMEVGGCWYTGYGVPINREKGIKWLERSAESGYDQAQGILGKMLLLGDEVPQDAQRGLALLHAGANQGKPWISMEIGNAYRDGIGVQKDLVQAYKWYAASAAGRLDFYCGEVEPQMSEAQLDRAKGLAAHWVRIKAEEGCDFAQYRFGLMLRFGTVLPKNQLHAYRCLLLASAQGHHEASIHCRNIERELSPTSISAARAFANSWVPGMSLDGGVLERRMMSGSAGTNNH